MVHLLRLDINHLENVLQIRSFNVTEANIIAQDGTRQNAVSNLGLLCLPSSKNEIGPILMIRMEKSIQSFEIVNVVFPFIVKGKIKNLL